MSFSVVNTIAKTVSRVLPAATRSMAAASTRPFTRSLWYLSNSHLNQHSTPWGQSCACGCGLKSMHTKGDQELVEFLSEEIAAEKKNQKATRLPSNLEGFDVKLNGAELSLTKKFNDEQISLTLNVNHSVDAEMPEMDITTQSDKAPDTEMKSKPQFEVKIVKKTHTLRFACSFLQDASQGVGDEGISDVFTVDEVAVFEGEPNEQTYAVAGDILDGYLYDLLMNMLEERGVSNDFADKISDLATKYEHGLYINLLEKMQKFVQGN
nr:EOG090X0APE [Eulimnadia texana]